MITMNDVGEFLSFTGAIGLMISGSILVVAGFFLIIDNKPSI